MPEWLIGVIVGSVTTVIGGYLLNGVVTRQRRAAVLRMLRTELLNFRGKMVLEPLEPREYPVVSTINVLLMNQALLTDVWDYAFDEELITALTELVEEVHRYNEVVKLVNSFTYGAAFNSEDKPVIHATRVALYEQLSSDLSVISQRVDSVIGLLNTTLSAAAE